MALAGATVQAAFRSTAGSTISEAVVAAVSTLSERVLMTIFLLQLEAGRSGRARGRSRPQSIVPGFLAASDRPPASSAANGSGPKAMVPGAAEGRLGEESGKAVDQARLEGRSDRPGGKSVRARALERDRDLPGRYYNKERGYWMYYKEYERRNDGKQFLFKPFALIWQSGDKKELKTVTADEAVMDLDRPLGLSVDKPGTPPLRVVNVVITGNVRIRDDRGTADTGDDLIIGPMAYAEYDEPTGQIPSESDVVIRGGNLRITGFGLRIAIDLMGSHTAPGSVGRIDEATPMFLRRGRPHIN